MIKKLVIIKIAAMLPIFFILSCSSFGPQSSKEYSVTKKSPLIMPPDMNMVPPESQKLKNKSYENKKNENDEEVSLEDILMGEIKIKKNIKIKKIENNKYLRKKLVNRILRTKASKVLE